jgi:hypothetical protein
MTSPCEFCRDGEFPIAVFLTYSFDPLFFERIPSPLDQRLRAKHHRIDLRKQTPGGRLQIGIPAGFK